MRAYEYNVCGSCEHFGERFVDLTKSHPFRSRSNHNLNLAAPRVITFKFYNCFVYDVFIPWNENPYDLKPTPH